MAFFIIVISFPAACIFTYALFKRRKQHISFNITPQDSCDQCRYLSDSSYLKCALHPLIALTAKATDCKDYHLKQEKKLVRNWRQLLESMQNIWVRVTF